MVRAEVAREMMVQIKNAALDEVNEKIQVVCGKNWLQPVLWRAVSIDEHTTVYDRVAMLGCGRACRI
jgi:hypothetical protein